MVRLNWKSRFHRALGAKVLSDGGFFTMDRPTQWRALINCVPDVQPRASFYKQFYYFSVAGADCLVQRRRVGMEPVRVVSVRILARIEQQLDDLGVTVLGGEREGGVSALTV